MSDVFKVESDVVEAAKELHFKRVAPPRKVPDALSSFEYDVHGYIWAGDGSVKTIVQTAELANAIESVLSRAKLWHRQANLFMAEADELRAKLAQHDEVVKTAKAYVAVLHRHDEQQAVHEARREGALSALIIAVQPTTQQTAAELHARFAHPGYEYATTRGERKAWPDVNTPPEGDGWERNTDAGYGRGWERFVFHEESYWRRITQVTGEPQ